MNRRKLNKKLIKQLALGDIVVEENTGILEDLREVLKAAFPQDHRKPDGSIKYYKYYKSAWDAVNKTTLPSIPLTDFFISEPEVLEPTELQWNQPVEIRDREDEEWRHGYVFGCINPNPKSIYPFLVFKEGSTDSYRFKFCRPAQQPIKLTRAEYAKKLGISVEQIDKVEIVD